MSQIKHFSSKRFHEISSSYLYHMVPLRLSQSSIIYRFYFNFFYKRWNLFYCSYYIYSGQLSWPILCFPLHWVITFCRLLFIVISLPKEFPKFPSPLINYIIDISTTHDPPICHKFKIHLIIVFQLEQIVCWFSTNKITRTKAQNEIKAFLVNAFKLKFVIKQRLILKRNCLLPHSLINCLN